MKFIFFNSRLINHKIEVKKEKINWLKIIDCTLKKIYKHLIVLVENVDFLVGFLDFKKYL